MKFGCVVGGDGLRKRRSRAEEDFHKVEMEQGKQNERTNKKKNIKKKLQEPLASSSFPCCI